MKVAKIIRMLDLTAQLTPGVLMVLFGTALISMSLTGTLWR